MSHRFAFVVALLALAVLPAAAQARDGRTIQLQDRCDPATFNAALHAVVCTKDGGVTFAEFLRRLNPQDGGHHAWRFHDDDVDLNPGETLTVRNVGGETHSFTEVASFGATPVPLFAFLNQALPPGTPFADVLPGDPRFTPAGASFNITGLAPGTTHRYECLIHPWMRATVTVGARHGDD